MPYRSPTHKPPFAKSRVEQERQRKQRFDQQRPNASERGYDYDWQRLRAAFLKREPFCQVVGCSRLAVDVDHLRDVRRHPELRLDWSNLRSLCHSHHSRRTAIEQGFARPRSLKENGT